MLNFGWAYSGMWQVVKRVLPKPALERILFPSKDDLLEFFDESSLLKGALNFDRLPRRPHHRPEHGGTIRYRYAFKGSVFHRLGRPVFASPSPSANASPWQSRTPSRSNSFESLADVYHSTTVSPHSSRPPTPGTGSQRSSANLSMTSLASAVAANAAKTNGRPIKRARSSADFRSHLPERDLALSSSESDISADEAVKARVAKRRGGDSATSSRVHSRAPSRDASPVRSRQSSVSDKPEPTHLVRALSPSFLGFEPEGQHSPASAPPIRSSAIPLLGYLLVQCHSLHVAVGNEISFRRSSTSSPCASSLSAVLSLPSSSPSTKPSPSVYAPSASFLVHANPRSQKRKNRNLKEGNAGKPSLSSILTKQRKKWKREDERGDWRGRAR